MKKLFAVMGALALATGVGSAMAEGTQQQQKGQTQQGQMQKGQQHPQKTAAYTGRQEITGHIVDIDNQKGNVKVQTDQGQLEFQFPPASLQGLNQGDPVQLQVEIRKQPAQKEKSGGQQPKGQEKQPQHQGGGQQ